MKATPDKSIPWILASFVNRTQRFDKHHKAIARGMIVVFTFMLLGKLTGAAKEMAIAWRYGVSETVDAYLFVFNLAQWPIGIIGGVLGAVLVPLAAKIRHEAPGNLSSLRAELWTGTLIVGFVLGLIAWIALPWLVQQPWLGLTSRQSELARQMATYIAWVIPFGITTQLLAAWTMSDNRHLNTLAEGIPALTVLLAVLSFGGPKPLIWGIIIGFALQAVSLYIPLARRGDTELPLLSYQSQYWPSFFAGFGLMLVGQALMSCVSLVDQFFAAQLGAGALSTLGYANRILSLIIGLGAVAIGRSILPVLSRAHAEGNSDTVRIAFRWAMLLLGVGAIISTLGLWLAPITVEILFQRGQFSPGDTTRVSELLRYALLQVPFYYSSMVLVYTLLSQSRHKFIVLVASVNLFTKLTLSYVLAPALGLNGLVLATSGVYLVSALFSMSMLRYGHKRKYE